MSTEKPLVSIVTPAYNEEKYIDYNLRSVAAQTYENIEHVVIDDGSDDNTSDILEQYEDKYNLRWRSHSNRGQAETLNRAFETVEGEIIVWLNADDILVTTDAVSSLVSFFQANPSIDIAYARRATLDSENKVRNIRVPIPRFTDERLGRWCFGAFIFYRREVIKEHKLDSEYRYALDYEYFLRLSEQGFRFGYLNKTILGYRVHEDTKSLDAPDEMRQESRRARRVYGQEFGPTYIILRSFDRLLYNLMKLYGILVLITLYYNRESLAVPETMGTPFRLLATQLRTFLPGES